MKGDTELLGSNETPGGRSGAEDRAALWRAEDRTGRCHYTFTVPAPAEAGCPQTGGGPEVEGLKARLSLLEVLVARLSGAGDAAAAGGAARSGLQEALDRTTGERNLLRGEKERLEQELEGLQRRVEEMRREAELQRSRPCPPQTPAVPPGPPPPDRAAGGERHTRTPHTDPHLHTYIYRNIYTYIYIYIYMCSSYSQFKDNCALFLFQCTITTHK
ncbi:Myocilin [Liparis tanakae]|uniref:Myocilin n=1 Tax=Liparis tanakae TaxID=230148 RepID=A0A4Z2EH48_9TELE|nr:Myocilin [Liparis tanakae]